MQEMNWPDMLRQLKSRGHLQSDTVEFLTFCREFEHLVSNKWNICGRNWAIYNLNQVKNNKQTLQVCKPPTSVNVYYWISTMDAAANVEGGKRAVHSQQWARCICKLKLKLT